MSPPKVVEKIKTHMLCSITFFRKSCRLWHNVEKYGTAGKATDDKIIRRTRFALRITKVTVTLRIFSTYCFLMVIMIARLRLDITLHYIASCSALRDYVRAQLSHGRHLASEKSPELRAETHVQCHRAQGQMFALGMVRLFRLTHNRSPDFRTSCESNSCRPRPCHS